jgi:hypothetical protein
MKKQMYALLCKIPAPLSGTARRGHEPKRTGWESRYGSLVG